MSTKKAPSKKPAQQTPASKTGKAALDKAAADLRKLQKAEKSPKKGKLAPAPSSAKGGGEAQLIAPTKPSERPIEIIMQERVTMDANFSSLTLAKETPFDEFISLFDHALKIGQRYQFIEGALYNEGYRLYGDTFAHQMAASGRPISTLKKWGSIEANVPKELRNLHPALEWSHCAEVAPLADDPKAQKEILTTAAKEAKAGKVPSVKVIRERVQKIKPKQQRKPKKTKAKKEAVQKRPLTIEERDVMIELEDAAAKLESLIGGASFVIEIETEATITLREKLGAIARFNAKIST